MKKYVRIYKKEHEFVIEVLDEMPEFKTAMPVGIMVGEGTEILLNLDNENDLSELLHAFACTVAKENVKLGKNVAKGIIKSAKDGIKKLANKGKESKETEK